MILDDLLPDRIVFRFFFLRTGVLSRPAGQQMELRSFLQLT